MTGPLDALRESHGMTASAPAAAPAPAVPSLLIEFDTREDYDAFYKEHVIYLCSDVYTGYRVRVVEGAPAREVPRLDARPPA